jgi:hypothetical protein
VVEWETVAELDTVGFYLNRWDWESGEYVQVNDDLLLSLLEHRQGGVYSYEDYGAIPGALHRYELVEVEASGRRNVYGPFTIDTAKKSAENKGRAVVRSASQYSAAPHQGPPPRAVKATGKVKSAKARKVTGDRVKITVRESGVYFLAFQELAVEFGMPVPAVRNWFRTGLYGLSNMGEPVAFILAGDGSGLFFYGEEAHSHYARHNVYWAEKGHMGLQMDVRNEEPWEFANGDETFTRTLHEEKDLVGGLTIFDDPEGDFWLWNYIYSGLVTGSYTLRADAAAAGSGHAYLKVRLKGSSNTEADPDHHAVIRLNGTEIGDVSWDGQKAPDPTFSFDAVLLVDGENTVEIEGLRDTDAPYSLFYLDFFELKYESYFRAAENRLEFSPGFNSAIMLHGFTRPDILVFDITDPKWPVFIETATVEFDDGTFGVDMAPGRSDASYLAVALDEVPPAPEVRADEPSSLRDSANEGEYVIVTTRELKAAAGRLAAHRGGMSSMVVDLEDVYDEFNFGLQSPKALKDFLAHAWRTWATPLRYVVLAGHGSFDYKDNMGKGDNLVPAKVVSTPYWLTVSDNWFGEVKGDGGAPEIAVGRLPARDESELGGIIDKIIARETVEDGPWLKRLLLLADKPDKAGNFHEGSDEVASLAFPNYATDNIYLPVSPFSEARSKLFESIDEGRGLISYIGHAGYTSLAGKKLLRDSDVPGLANAEKPFVLTAMTCLVGNFSFLSFPTIGELLVQKEGGGAAAVWAPSGVSQNRLAVILAESFYETALGDSDVRIGDAILKALKDYEKTGKMPYMMDIYVLLGDPAMWLH